VKVYLDANILSRFTDYPRSRLTEDEKRAIGELADVDEINFVTSRKALDEFQRSGDPDRRELLKLLYRLMSKIPSTDLFAASLYGEALYGDALYGGAPDDLYVQLKALFDNADAQHIFQAIKGRCDYFLTLDTKTILRRVRVYEKEVAAVAGGLRFGTPAELAAEIGRGAAAEPPKS
jgi:hypothetical protein